MTTFRTTIAGLALFLAACGTSESSKTDTGAKAPGEVPPVEEPAAAEEPAEPFELFGDPLDTKVAVVDFAEIAKAPDSFKNRTIVTNGIVRASCEKRGCWMEIRPEADRNGTAVTVRFKDYGFFVPLDSRGARVKFQADVKVVMLTPEQVKEMESEGGSVTGKLPDGSAKATLLIASGVEMRGRKQAK